MVRNEMDALNTKKILVFRLSALGDIAISIPVLYKLIEQNPNIEVTFVSRAYASHFSALLPNVRFFRFDESSRHKGILGLIRLFIELKSLEKWDGIVDLHDVLRTKIVRFILFIFGFNVVVIDKGRREKKRLTSRFQKKLVQIKPTYQRYAEVFRKLNLNLSEESFAKAIPVEGFALTDEIIHLTGKKEHKWVGIAPFAKHKGKSYPIEYIRQVVEHLAEINNTKIFLFGGAGCEAEILDSISQSYSNVTNLAGLTSLDKELIVMANLNVMISMDSANMHLASLVGVPVISVWGATHPYAGFYGWNQNYLNAIQLDLDCRPCSVYGNKPCFRKDYACLHRIQPHDIVVRVIDLLGASSLVKKEKS